MGVEAGRIDSRKCSWERHLCWNVLLQDVASRAFESREQITATVEAPEVSRHRNGLAIMAKLKPAIQPSTSSLLVCKRACCLRWLVKAPGPCVTFTTCFLCYSRDVKRSLTTPENTLKLSKGTRHAIPKPRQALLTRIHKFPCLFISVCLARGISISLST